MMIKKVFVFIYFTIAISHICHGQLISRLDNTIISAAALDEKINTLVKAANVHGLAVAVFNNNKAVYKNTFGYKNFDLKQPLRSNTNLYGASLSKAVFAVLVMKLVEEGLIDLDTPLESYLLKPIYEYTPLKRWHDNYADLRNDSLYKSITARMCLSHSTGFANWRWDEKDRKLKVNFQPGTKYGYSGEGMVYLQVVIEKLTGKSLEELMNEKIFKPLNMLHSAYSWKEDYEKDYAWGHKANGNLYEKDKDNEPRAASTLETTLG
jgi:serine-type D-Ala-D-Ala carboxypeptidase/endopeptidase